MIDLEQEVLRTKGKDRCADFYRMLTNYFTMVTD
jgi:hypothetical protein